MYSAPWIDESLSHEVNAEREDEGSHNHNWNIANDGRPSNKDAKGTDS